MTDLGHPGRPRRRGAVLRFERVLAHPPEQVFRAISEPEELRHWFPAGVEWELRPGAPIRFAFERGRRGHARRRGARGRPAAAAAVLAGATTCCAWEIAPEGAGCRLVFTHVLAPGGMSGGLPGAARNAAGWDVCLAALAARLDGAPAPELAWFPRFEDYAERFGLGEAAGDRGRRAVRARRGPAARGGLGAPGPGRGAGRRRARAAPVRSGAARSGRGGPAASLARVRGRRRDARAVAPGAPDARHADRGRPRRAAGAHRPRGLAGAPRAARGRALG